MENKKEWIVGREGDIPVSGQYVSRRHARLTKEADGLYIEDLDSKAGTYVNGKAVKKKKIGLRDRVLLGPDCVLNVGEVLAQIPLSDAEFTQAFHQLKAVYETYSKTKLKTQSQSQGKMMLKRSLPMAAPGILVAIAGRDPVTMIVGAALSALAMVGGSMWGAKEMERIPERIFELDEQFKMDYACPDCKRSFGPVPWEGLRRQGQCPYCKRKFNA
ncbi:MAG: FHA domain-containing protein [Tannerella sp.]|jgi:DNA-directed RNA polymerase subunit RPC12/RpoP|nr:FHA domain-containing protein [Tannerella sp.]